MAVIALTGWICVAVPLLGSRDLISAAPAALSLAGAVITFRSWRIGLGLAGVAPVVAAALAVNPTGAGILAILVALLLALRGASPVLVGAVVTMSNLLASSFYFGLSDAAGRWPSVVIVGAVLTAAVGAAVRSRSEVKDGREQHERDVASNRELEIRNAVAEERVRIARDLHDGIGHGIAVISMHVGTAEVMIPSADSPAQSSLQAAREAIKTVLEETQHTLHMLRVPTDSGDEPITNPQALAGLINSYLTAGLPIKCYMPEPIDQLPARITAATYRIVQEMLTNAQRHADGIIDLHIVRTASEVHVTCRNSIAQNAGTIGGNGLIGMRERCESLGGSLDSYADDHDFSVTARLPLPYAKMPR
ncbi:histidine kinase [Herbiconiux sp. 11R-BC]|uniref:sensor histidine kinase n=1 Tax=Herbiconiux sp. 11R-BC TaxID=3111637 RepID=UPI003C040FDD